MLRSRSVIDHKFHGPQERLSCEILTYYYSYLAFQAIRPYDLVGQGTEFLRKRFPIQTQLWSMEFVIHNKPRARYYPNYCFGFLLLAFKFFQLYYCLITFQGYLSILVEVKGELNEFLKSMKKLHSYSIFIQMVIYIVEILLCFSIFTLNDSFLQFSHDSFNLKILRSD